MDFIQKRELILNGNMRKVILTLSLPIMLNNFIRTIYNLTDTFFVSKIPGNAVAGVQFIWPLIFLITSFGIGMTVATSSIIAQYIGAQMQEKARKTAGQSISFLFVLSLVLGLIGYLGAPTIIRAMGGTGELYDNAYAYLSIMFLGMPTTFLLNAYNAIKQGQGDTMSPLIIGALSIGTNIILDPILMFGLDMGIQGAAIATVISTGVFAVYGIITTFDEKQSLKLELSDLKFNKEILMKIVNIGLPSSTGQAMTAFGFTILNVFLVSFGEVTLTAFAIGNRISSLIMMPAMGIGNALATIVGQNLGADNVSRAKLAVRNSTIMSTIFLVVGGLIMLPFVQQIVKAFSTDPEVIKNGTEYLTMIIYGIPLMGFFQILVGTFQGSGHTISAMILMMGRLWVLRIPMVYMLSRLEGFGPSSIWLAMIASNLITCLIGLGIYSTGRWQSKIIKQKKSVLEDLSAA
ncbi:MATE family efflux transporter [Fusibacter bizertensis]|uniref:MATE family efflux transporter n=1 Tax=Fusibacter bizertensis TaxID=1488331 RepID=A0ABT6NEY5_9FIRM|nr:MATE family efflux transporter [Fusibacter bizertensis]MDH8678957.1 MATE family efflux transporter [Fusibacter bizertensis]